MLKALLALGIGLVTCPVLAQERIHSDLPLFANSENLWPRGFVNGDEFGCTSRVAFGDWKYEEHLEGVIEPAVKWLRLGNYGVFHCAAVETWASERAELGKGGYKNSWFVDLGKLKLDGGTVELWLLQSGARPGSDYVLLRRTPVSDVIKRFDVLPVDCPNKNLRTSKGPDTWRTDYCAINSVAELRAFVTAMARRPAVGTLTFEGESPDEPAER